MSVNIKVHGGTSKSGENLCRRCRNAVHIRGQKESDEIIRCSELGSRVHFPVTTCSSFDDKTSTELYEMKKIAWLVATDRKTGQIGFYNQQDFERLRKKGDLNAPDYNKFDDEGGF